MLRTRWMWMGFVALVGVALVASAVYAKEEAKAKVELPEAVAAAVRAACPGAEIDKVDVEKEAGITLYDIEFKPGQGEIEVAEDGTIIDVTTIVQMKDVPEAAAKAIQKAAEGATIKQLEKAEVRAEIQKEGEKGKIVKLDKPKYVFEAELVKGDQEGEIAVAPDGTIVEELKWKAKGAPDKEDAEKGKSEKK